MGSKPESAIWSRDTGQRISWYDSCQLHIICMSNINDICCNPRLHDLVLAGCRMAAMLCDVVRRRRRRWAHASVIHAASHFDHNKRVAWVPISMHTCGSFFYNYGAPLGGPSGRRSSAITWSFNFICLCPLSLTVNLNFMDQWFSYFSLFTQKWRYI